MELPRPSMMARAIAQALKPSQVRQSVGQVDREKREVVVKLGSMNMRIALDEVTLYESL